MVECLACRLVCNGLIFCSANYRIKNNQSRWSESGRYSRQRYLFGGLHALPYLYCLSLYVAGVEKCCFKMGLWSAYYHASIYSLLYSYAWRNLGSTGGASGHGRTQY